MPSHWKNILSWSFFALFLIVLIFFAENIYNNQRCQKITIQLEKLTDGDFVTKASINKSLTNNGDKPILGTKFNLLNFNRLENNILINKLVKSCQISRTIGGDLIVKVQQQNPIARVVSLSGSSDKFNGLYLDSEGNFFPLSPNFTKRVVLVSGKYFIGKHNLHAKADLNILAFINKIDLDDFWKANITHIVIDDDKNISFLPLIGNFILEYGIPLNEEFEQKMKKIEIYYSKVEPQNSGKYKMVSVKYKNQIVCQLRELL